MSRLAQRLRYAFGKVNPTEHAQFLENFYTQKVFGKQIYPIVRDGIMKYGFKINDPALLRLNLYSGISNTQNHLEIGPADINHTSKAIQDKDNCKILLIDIMDGPMTLAKQQLIESGFKESNIICINANIVDNDNIVDKNCNKNNIILPFDSIGMSFVLHCMRGPMKIKLVSTLNSMKKNGFIDKNTIFIGNTITKPENESNFFAKKTIKARNEAGDFDNLNDSYHDIKEILNNYFNVCDVQKCGQVTQWVCKDIKN